MKKQILVEIQPGIDVAVSATITDDIGEYWLPDEQGILRVTGYSGAIPGNLWQVDTEILEPNESGSTSESWELVGDVLRIGA